MYSNVFGYCGGVAYAIMVAYICKMNPTLETCQLLDTFFRYYRYRQWTYDNPLFLDIQADPEKVQFHIDNDLFYKKEDRTPVFPIITPAFPSMNSTYNVSATTRNIMLTELEKAMHICNHLMTSKNPRITWKRLFKKFPFFKAYQHFIRIQILSKNEEIHEKWKGFVESKLRRLVSHLETLNRQKYRNCMEIRPYPKAFHLKNKVAEGFELDNTYYFGIRVKNIQTTEQATDIRERHPQIDLTDTRTKFFSKVIELMKEKEYAENRERQEVDVDIQCLTREELDFPVDGKAAEKAAMSIPAADIQPLVGQRRNHS